MFLKLSRLLALVLVMLTVFVGVASATGPSEQNMCAECDVLREKLRIVQAKTRAFNEGLGLLQEARGELRSNKNIADGLAATYVILQGLNVSFGLATLPCSISYLWLKGLVGGAGGLSTYLQDGDAGKASLAAVVGYIGLGVFNDAISAYDFLKNYSSDSKGLTALGGDIDKTVRELRSARERLNRERRIIEADMSRGGCRGDNSLEFLH